MRESSPSWSRRSPTASRGQGVDVVDDRPRLHRPALLRVRRARTCPARCSPRATTPPSTTASSSAAPAPRPVGQDTGLREIRDLRRAASRPACLRTTGRPARSPAATCSPTTRAYLRRSSTCRASARCRSSSTPATAWPATPCPTVLGGLPLTVHPLYFELDGTLPQPRGQPDRAGEPASTCRPRSRARGADLGLAFDGDADRCFVVDERGDVGRPLDAHRADRGARARQRPRARRSSTT